MCVGSRPYQFNRLFIELDRLFDEGAIESDLFAQVGSSDYIPRNYPFKDYLSPDEFKVQQECADIVISHGASGSIMGALNAGKKVIAVTRLEKYGEHINDHQIAINETLAEEKLVLSVFDMSELGSAIQAMEQNQVDLVEWHNDNPLAIVEEIDAFIQREVVNRSIGVDKKKLLKRAKRALRFVPDRLYIQLYYFPRFHKLCNFSNPTTYNEKLQWLKLNDRNPMYVDMVDKVEAKRIAAQIIGEDFIIPTLGVWDRFDDIDFDALPNRFVLKCTHDSEGIVIVKDKASLDIEEAKKRIEEALSYNFYCIGREWPYKNLKPRILAEQYMEDSSTGELRDYKFFCFDGEPKAMFVASGRSAGETKFDYFDLDFSRLDIVQHYPNSSCEIEKPISFDQMVAFAKKLSAGIPHVRIDFYEVNGRLYFGEFTFYHFSGFMPFEPSKWDKTFGSWLCLPESRRRRGCM